MITEETVEECFNRWNVECDNFKGDKALFWAGKMSTLIRQIEVSQFERVGSLFNLLSKCRTQYDVEIYRRAE